MKYKALFTRFVSCVIFDVCVSCDRMRHRLLLVSPLQGIFIMDTLLLVPLTESNTFASYLDLLLSIGRDGQLRTSLYDKRHDFNFHITNFPFLSSNIPSSPAYDVFISQLIRYARACSSYECFILRAVVAIRLCSMINILLINVNHLIIFI